MSHAEEKTYIPRRLNHYELIEEVGHGGLGRVFKAKDTRTQALVAIKILHAKYYDDQRFLGIFHRELMIMASLHHKHIVSYLDSHFRPPIYFVVTEFVDGWSGYAFGKKVKKVPPLVAICILMDIMQGIDHLHLHDIVHSDLSAANYMLDKNGRVFVADFGLACVQDVEDYKSHVIGTPGYHAPEHLQDTPIVPQSDIFCAGIILFELLCGVKPAVPQKNREMTLYALKHIKYDLINSNDRKMQKMLRKLAKNMLQFKASKRLQSAEDVMLGCYEILKTYNIRYTRYAIKQFLHDSSLVAGEFESVKQDIYLGL